MVIRKANSLWLILHHREVNASDQPPHQSIKTRQRNWSSVKKYLSYHVISEFPKPSCGCETYPGNAMPTAGTPMPPGCWPPNCITASQNIKDKNMKDSTSNTYKVDITQELKRKSADCLVIQNTIKQHILKTSIFKSLDFALHSIKSRI